MFALTTSVEIPKELPQINHTQRILLMGSCFAENIGNLLVNHFFNCDVNPFGIAYNPASVSTALNEILEGKVYTQADLFLRNGLWHSSMHHGAFSSISVGKSLQSINERLQKTHKQIKEINWLLITWGTAYIYESRETGQIVSNCHKQPEQQFIRRKLTVEEIVNDYKLLLANLWELNPNIKILFTVSPIRHIRDGMHANQLSKSTLLLAIDHLQNSFPDKTFYFPSYEIVLDELRDYRFYADDMLHPSSTAIDYLWERFSETFFSSQTKKIMEECKSIHKALQHRPLYPGSEEHKSFLEQIVLKIEQLNRKYPYLVFEKEIELCRIQLNQ